jgi:NAD(P)-dependent dehydrogenase (short-subunit alcohol dehydrogenase family)
MDYTCSTPPKSQIPTDLRFEGKTIVITGAGGQFGRAGCLYFCQRGARVAALDTSTDGLQATYDALALGSSLGKDMEFSAYACDVTDAAAVAAVVDKIVVRFQKIDLLWNNAGYQGQIRNTLEYDPADFSNVMNINVTGMFIVLQAVARQMAKQFPELNHSIVNTASVAALRGTPGMIAYSSSKAAVISMTVCAAKDLAIHKIRVNSLSPALIGPGHLWDRQNTLHAELGPPYFAATSEQVAKDKINSVPLKRLGSVEEVLQSLAFLLSSDASYTTGTNLVVDGGLSAGMK